MLFGSALREAFVHPARSRVAIALSGGPDSMAMAGLTVEWAGNAQEPAMALIVDHGLRPESSDEAAAVATAASALGLTPHTLRVDWGHAGVPRPGGVMPAARQVRYELLMQACESLGASHLLVAHHADDQAETFLLRLLHASGIQGLACMPLVSRLPGHERISVVRPLLEAHKHELLEYCQLHRLPYVTDPTNTDLSFQRNRIRWLLANVPYSQEAAAEEAASCAVSATSRREQREQAAGGAYDPQVPPVVRDILCLQRACAEVATLLTQQSNRLLRQVVLHTSAPGLPNKRQADEHRRRRMEQQRGQQQGQRQSSKAQQIGSRWEQQEQATEQHSSAAQEPEQLGVHWPTVLPRLASELTASGLQYSLLRLPRLAGAENPIAEAALARVLQATSSADYPPSTANVVRLWERLRSGTMVVAYTGGGCLVRPVPRSKGRYALVVPQAAQMAAEELMRSVVRAGTVNKGSKGNSGDGRGTAQPADIPEETAAEG